MSLKRFWSSRGLSGLPGAQAYAVGLKHQLLIYLTENHIDFLLKSYAEVFLNISRKCY
jgi:hypothetical protein